MILVQFYSLCATKHVTISKHKSLSKAIESARKAWLGSYSNVSILLPDGTRVDRYGKENPEIL